MIYEYAISPNLCQDYQDLRFFTQTFGREEGRLFSDVPKKQWMRLARLKIKASNNGQIMKKRLFAAVDRLHRKAMHRRNAVPKSNGENWLDQALAVHQDRPFQAIITDSYDGNEKCVLSIQTEFTDDFRWKIPLDLSLERSAEKMIEVIRPMLDCAREIILIDRNFNPHWYRWRPFLIELASILSHRSFSPSINKIGFHVGDRIAANHLELLCKKHIKKDLPDNIQVIFFVWPREELHDRYVLTDIGGVRFGIGLDIWDGHGQEEVEISRVSEKALRKWWRLCKNRTSTFSIP